MTAPLVTPLPDPPSPFSTPSQFSADAFIFVAALSGWTGDINNLVDWLNANIDAREVVNETGTAFDLNAQNSGAYVRTTNGSAKTLTVQPESVTAQPEGASYFIANRGAGDLTIVAGEDVTINGNVALAENATAILQKIDTDTYDLITIGGDFVTDLTVLQADVATLQSQMTTRIQSVATIADLRALQPSEINQVVYVKDHTSPGSGVGGGSGGGGGFFRAGTTGATTDNDGTQIVYDATWVWRRVGFDKATPKMFGAVGDGVADDTASIQAAATYERIVSIPKGAYLVTDRITLLSNTIIEGASRDESVLIVDLAEDDPVANCLFFASAANNLKFKNLTVIYSGTTTRKCRIAYIEDGDNIQFENITCAIDGFAIFEDCTNIRAFNCHRGEIGTATDVPGQENGGSLFSLRGSVGCEDIQMDNLSGVDLAEAIDVGLGNNIQLSNLSFTSRDPGTWDGSDADTANFDEAIDLGGATNVEITNFNFQGFGRGIFIKEESTTSCADISISNGTINDYAVCGVDMFCRAGLEPGDPAVIQRVKLNNVTCTSTRTNSKGIRNYDSGNTSGSEDIQLTGVTVSCWGVALDMAAVRNLKIKGGSYYSSDKSAARFIPSVGGTTSISSDIVFEGAHLITDSALSTEPSLYALRVSNLRVMGGVLRAPGGRCIDMTNVYRPVVKGVEFGNDSVRVFNLSWTIEAWLVGTDGDGLGCTFDIVDNVCSRWRERWLNVTISGIGSSVTPYKGGRICGNNLIADEIQPGAETQCGIELAGVATDVLDWTMITGNSVRAQQTIRNTAQLGANALVANNIETTS